MKTKIFFGCLFLIAFISACMHTSPAQAEEQQTIVVTSLSFNDKKDLQIQTGPGKQIEPLKNAKGINNKNFQLYDVTDGFKKFRQTKQDLNSTDLDKQFLTVMTNDKLKNLTFSAAISQTTIYGEGTAIFNVIRKDEQGYHVYLLKELGADSTIAPMLIRLPVMDQGNELNPIHLYTKSVVKIDPAPEVSPVLTKKINNKKFSYSFGDKIVYHVDFTIPSSVTNAKSVKLVDTYDTGLRKLSGYSISLRDQKISDDIYTESSENNQTTYNFDPKRLANYIGKTLRVEYTLLLTDEASEQSEFNNTIKLLIEEKEILRAHETVITGGKHFKKVDISTGEPLPGAVFYLTNSDGEFLSSYNGSYQWETNSSNALPLMSNQDGTFSINGLAYGHYFLHELKAPNNYIRNQDSIKVDVAKGSFENEPYQFLEIVNKKATTNSSDPVTPINNPNGPISSNNSMSSNPSGTTPYAAKQYAATGEKISTWTTVLGVLLLVAVAWVFKKRSEKK